MRTRRAAAEHQEAVSRRLALLSAELAAERPGPGAVLDGPPASPEPDWTSGHTRVRPPAGPPPATSPPPPLPPPPRQPEPPPGPPAVPEPGRHAARRRMRLVPPAADLVPETLRGRAALGSAQLTVVAVVVALGLAITCWWVVRGDAGTPVAPAPVDASPVAELVPVPPVAAPTVPTSAASSGGAPVAEVVVDVAGKVRRPGIVVLDTGARVVDALEAAGGARPGVDLSSLNLARVLVDGEQVLVGGAAAQPLPGPTGATGVTGTPGTPTALVDLNAATPVELEALPEVGPVTAAAIVGWRDEHGGFTTVDELLEVDGIGEATLAQMRSFVTVGGG
ncbi:helix-hairpin-helix domain-containing protein [Nocardioides sp. SOB77]|uniref:Helix-hairpin-helix domain-containing protein n=1 Tax=Nocardioides oceani TaxID=3058369 RepID=A0ABT8FIM0_9ACTN|nr:helix-hairpin-helix domain-containing protein [Nocardioides oceani]MDN4174384.1 helix-hairpin-helix domain-containing protein [Nocardioides oceani]